MPKQGYFQEFKIDTGDYIFELRTMIPLMIPCQLIFWMLYIQEPASMATITADGGTANPSYVKSDLKSPRGGGKIY